MQMLKLSRQAYRIYLISAIVLFHIVIAITTGGGLYVKDKEMYCRVLTGFSAYDIRN